MIAQFEETPAQIKSPAGLLPVCSRCKKVLDYKGYSTQVEYYLQLHSNRKLTHGVRPECAEKFRKEAGPVPQGWADGMPAELSVNIVVS